MFGTRKLGKTSAQRRAMLRQQVTDLLANGKMETTFYRAKEVQPVVEKMITLGKKGGLYNYRRAMSYITKEDVVQKLFKEIAPKYADRNGGYTRVTRIGARRGDAAEMPVIAADEILLADADLICKTSEDMMKVRNMGKKSLDEVQKKLEMMGLSLASEDASNN